MRRLILSNPVNLRNNIILLISAILLIFASFGYQIEHTIFNNDWLHNLDQGLGIDSSNRHIHKFKQLADENCILHSSDQTRLQDCLNYQNIITQNAYMSHPILGVFGSFLSEIDLTLPANDIALAIQNKIIFGGLVGVVLVSLFIIISAFFMNKDLFMIFSGLLIVIILTSEKEVGYIRKIHDGINWVNFLLPSFLALLGLYFSVNDRYNNFIFKKLDYFHDLLMRESHEKLSKLIYRIIFITLIYFSFTWILLFQNSPGVDDAVMIIAILVFFILALKNNTDPQLVVLIVLCLIIATSNLPSRAIYPRHLCAIWIGISIIAGMGSGKNIFLYLLPFSLIFHIGTAIVATGCLLIMEVFIFLFTRQPTKLMIVSGFTFIVGYTFTKIFWESGLHSGESILLPNLLLFAKNLFLFDYVILLCALMLFLSFQILRKAQCEDHYLTRALILSAIILFVCQISNSAKLMYGNTLDIQPGYFVLYRLPDYLTPSLSMAVLVFLILQIRRHPVLCASTITRSARVKSPKNLLVLSIICFFPISAIDVNIKKLFLSMDQYSRYLNTETIEPRFAQLFTKLQFNDDVYVLPNSDKPNSPVTYLSLLKLKMRISQGITTSVTISQ